MLYAFRGGQLIQAANKDELVKKLTEISLFNKKMSESDYMKDTANDIKEKQDVIIRIDSNFHFIDDLLKEGFIVEVTEDEIMPNVEKFRKDKDKEHD